MTITADILDLVRTGADDTDELVAGLLPDTIDATLDALFEADRQVAAAKETQRRLREHLASVIGEGGAYRDHTDMIYRSAQGKPRRIVTPGSERALFDWLGDDLARAVPATAVRVTSVRGIAEQRVREHGETDPGRIREHVETVESTFFTWQEDPDDLGLSLTILPVVKAPKFLQALAAGASYTPERETGETDE